MIIIDKNRDICADPQTRLDIVLKDNNTLGIVHCCHRTLDLSDILPIEDFYKMDKETFKKYLENAYYNIPVNHDYTVYKSCRAVSKERCIYGTKKLLTVGIGTSHQCNLLCPMCFEKNKKFLSIEADKKLYFHLLNLLKGNKNIGIRLTGYGEPFFYKKEMLDFLHNLSDNDTSHIEAISNTTLLNDDDIKELYDISKKIPLMIAVSCSAITPETYKIVHSQDYFNKVVNNIKLLNKYNLLEGINFVVQEENLHELEFYHDFWSHNGIDDNNIKLDVNIKAQSYNKILNSKEYQNYRNKYSIKIINTINGLVTF